MRSILTPLVSVLALFLSACASSVGDGVVESPSAEPSSLQDQFTESGERVLMQGVSATLDQSALDTAASPEEAKFAVRTEQGIFMMTQAQMNQYIAIQRARSVPAGSADLSTSPYGTVVSRTVVANAPSNLSAEPAAPAAPIDPTGIASVRQVPGAFDRYVAPGITITKGPDGFKNADGTHDCVLTFDDGPHHARDAQIYDILDEKAVKAVFFFLGKKVEANPNTTKAALARGHEVGYHSWDHKNLRAESLATVKADFKKGMDVFTSLGIAPKFFRPPFGNYNSGIIATARENGMEVVNWTNDSLDWKIKTTDGIVQHVLKQSAPGDIVLLHSIHERSVQALPSVIDGLRAQGCRFTTLASWMQRASS